MHSPGTTREADLRTGTIVSVDPTGDAAWLSLIQSHSSDVFHSPAWLRVVRDTFGLAPRALVLTDDDGQPRAGVSFCIAEEPGGGSRVVASPFSDFCDPLAPDDESWRTLGSCLLDEAPVVELRCLRAEPPGRDDRFEQVDRAKWHAVDASRDEEEIFSGFHSSARRAVRKAEKNGVEVRPATATEELRTFYDLHLQTRKHKYRLLAQPYRLFTNLWDEFIGPGRGALLGAWREGELIGGVVLLEWGNRLYYKYSASHLDHTEHRPNDLLIWHAVQHAHERGLSQLDLGLSDWDQEGLVRYKNKFATDEGTIHFLAHGTRPRSELTDTTLPALTELLTDDRVPDDVTEAGGSLLYHHFV